MCAMIRFARLKPSGLVLLLATVSLEAQNRRHWRVGGVLRDAARAAGAEDLSTQESPRISGHTTSEYGESQVRGTIDDRAIAFTFEATDGGKAVVIRVTAKVEGAANARDGEDRRSRRRRVHRRAQRLAARQPSSPRTFCTFRGSRSTARA
jgi:hypothetical protein